MRILWVEDQGTDEKQHHWFSKVDERCEIELVTSYNKAYTEISKSLDKYDLIILDINLEESDLSEQHTNTAWFGFGLDRENFLKEAGFHLFIQLMELAFPRERIIFLTGNVTENQLRGSVESLREAILENNSEEINRLFHDEILKCLNEEQNEKILNLIKEEKRKEVFNYIQALSQENDSNDTYDLFEKRFKEARIQPPQAIKKGQQIQDELKNWTDKHLEDSYLILRRGIIDGCNYISEQLDNNGKVFVLFNEFCKEDSDVKMDIDTAKDYLSLLANTLPNKICRDDTQFQLKLPLRTLAHEWESSFSPDFLSKCIKENDLKWLQALGYVMKTARNLLSHTDTLHAVDIRDVAFLFLINCRAMFLLGGELINYEKQLLLFFKSVEVEEVQLEKDLKSAYFHLKYDIFKNYINKKQQNGKRIEKTAIYNLMIQRLSQAEAPPDNIEYPKELYRIFFYYLIPRDFESRTYNTNFLSNPEDFQGKFIESFYESAFSKA